MWAIEAENLKKRFGSVEALKGITFHVKRGEVFGYLGMNGAGKTTTVRILTGIVKPDSGCARVMGFDISEDTLRAKEVIGVLPEVSNAYPDLTAWQNVMFTAELYGMNKREAEKRAEELLREFGIYDRRNCRVRGFSKGMKQRLMFCMALIGDPEVIFLDEPTSGLDVLSARMIREKVLELAKSGKTIFLTSHNMNEVNLLCDRVAIINRGKIVVIDTPGNIRARVGGSVALEIRFDRAVELPAEFRSKKVGDKYVVYTTDVHEAFCSVADFARRAGVKVLEVNTRSPTLEDAFLSVLGVVN